MTTAIQKVQNQMVMYSRKYDITDDAFDALMDLIKNSDDQALIEKATDIKQELESAMRDRREFIRPDKQIASE